MELFKLIVKIVAVLIASIPPFIGELTPSIKKLIADYKLKK